MHTSVGICSEQLPYKTFRAESFRRGIVGTALPSSSGQSAHSNAKWHLNSRNVHRVGKEAKELNKLIKLVKKAWYNARTAAQQG
jgi:hypothetical protein